MTTNPLILPGGEIATLFQGRELEIMNAVASAYQTHALGDSFVPHSSFLRFPDSERNRIIALPAYLGGDSPGASMKWIASFPGNLALGMERASAVLILNSTETGHIQAIMESSVISAKRTAASAALAGHTMRGDDPIHSVGMIGCGLINFETFRFLVARRPELNALSVFDLNMERANQFLDKCRELAPNVNFSIASSVADLFQQKSIVTLATTAVTPHIDDISMCDPNTVILHTSLRDFTAEIMLEADNVVDDVDHVCRAQTSLHLAEQQVNHRQFIRTSIGEILNGAPARVPNGKIPIYSPFGLGVLDLALGQLALQFATSQGMGIQLENFLPEPWTERTESVVA
ncbi:MAG: 2,3-diaminopropionate biosynthesis protein SbnB [Chloroflexota bacterium]